MKWRYICLLSLLVGCAIGGVLRVVHPSATDRHADQGSGRTRSASGFDELAGTAWQSTDKVFTLRFLNDPHMDAEGHSVVSFVITPGSDDAIKNESGRRMGLKAFHDKEPPFKTFDQIGRLLAKGEHMGTCVGLSDHGLLLDDGAIFTNTQAEFFTSGNPSQTLTLKIAGGQEVVELRRISD